VCLRQAGKNVGGDGGDFKRDEDDEQLDGRGEQAHADGAEDNERVELALVVGVLGQRVEREQEGDENDAADEDVEEDGEGAGLDGRVEARAFGQRKLPNAGPEGDRGSDGGDPAERAARPRGREARRR
jgi:Sec-independent protein translocase protein TatA